MLRGPAPLYLFMAKKLAIKIFYDDHTGEIADVVCSKRFTAEGTLFQLEVIKDVINHFEIIYEYEKREYFDELERTSGRQIAKA